MVTQQGFDVELTWEEQTPEQAKDDLATFLKLANTETFRIIESTQKEVVKVARRYVPVRTGKLQDSIAGTVRYKDDGIVLLIGSPVEYAYYVEFGTAKMAAQPYLRPALEEVGPKFEGALSTAIKRAALAV